MSYSYQTALLAFTHLLLLMMTTIIIIIIIMIIIVIYQNPSVAAQIIIMTTILVSKYLVKNYQDIWFCQTVWEFTKPIWGDDEISRCIVNRNAE